MNTIEHQLTTLGEECAEIQQRISKALRFGLDEVEPGQELNNRQRIAVELWDLIVVVADLQAKSVLGVWRDISLSVDALDHIYAKGKKLRRYMAYARECGTLTGE